MSKNYIEKVIEEKVSFEPDYSNIKKQVNIKPKKENQKRWVWPSLGIGLVSIAVIITIIVSLSLRSNPTPPYDGVHFNNYTSNGSGNGEPLPSPPMVSYSIDVEKDNYYYNEEFIIKYTIKDVSGSTVADRNNLNVKIVSDNFDFLSPTEYHFDLETDVSTYGNILSFGNANKDSIYPIEMELKVKAKEPNESLDTINIDNILFLLEFPLKEEFKEEVLQHVYESMGETYENGEDEFTKNLEWVHRLYYLNDVFGTLLVDDGKKYVYPNTDPKWPETIIVTAKTEIMYRSLNRLYDKQLITKQEYMKRLIYCLTNCKTYANIFVRTIINGKPAEDEAYMEYISKNIRVFFKWKIEYMHLLEKYYGSTGDTFENLAKELVGILFKNKYLTLEQYMIEIQTIEEKGVTSRNLRIYKDLVPFKDYMDYYYDYIIE